MSGSSSLPPTEPRPTAAGRGTCWATRKTIPAPPSPAPPSPSTSPTTIVRELAQSDSLGFGKRAGARIVSQGFQVTYTFQPETDGTSLALRLLEVRDGLVAASKPDRQARLPQIELRIRRDAPGGVGGGGLGLFEPSVPVEREDIGMVQRRVVRIDLDEPLELPRGLAK